MQGQVLLDPDQMTQNIKEAILLQKQTKFGVKTCIILQYAVQELGVQVVYFGRSHFERDNYLIEEDNVMQPIEMLAGNFNSAYYACFDSNTGYKVVSVGYHGISKVPTY